MSRLFVMLAVSLALVIASALSVVHAKHQSRKLFAELQSLGKQSDDLDVEWGKLQLEQSAWSRHERIEKVARDQLGLEMPQASDIVLVKP